MLPNHIEAFEVPLGSDKHEQTLAGLLNMLVQQGGFSEYTVERVSLESVFLKVIRENKIKEEGSALPTRTKSWFFLKLC